MYNSTEDGVRVSSGYFMGMLVGTDKERTGFPNQIMWLSAPISPCSKISVVQLACREDRLSHTVIR